MYSASSQMHWTIITITTITITNMRNYTLFLRLTLPLCQPIFATCEVQLLATWLISTQSSRTPHDWYEPWCSQCTQCAACSAKQSSSKTAIASSVPRHSSLCTNSCSMSSLRRYTCGRKHTLSSNTAITHLSEPIVTHCQRKPTVTHYYHILLPHTAIIYCYTLLPPTTIIYYYRTAITHCWPHL